MSKMYKNIYENFENRSRKDIEMLKNFNPDYNGQIIPNLWSCDYNSNFIYYPSKNGDKTYQEITPDFNCVPSGTVFSDSDGITTGYYIYNPGFYNHWDYPNATFTSMTPNNYSSYTQNDQGLTETISNIPPGVYYCQVNNTNTGGSYTQCTNPTGCNQINNWVFNFNSTDANPNPIPIPYCGLPINAFFTKKGNTDIHDGELDNFQATVNDCAQRCLMTNDCVAFTHDGSNSCYLKNNTNTSPSNDYTAYTLKKQNPNMFKQQQQY